VSHPAPDNPDGKLVTVMYVPNCATADTHRSECKPIGQVLVQQDQHLTLRSFLNNDLSEAGYAGQQALRNELAGADGCAWKADNKPLVLMSRLGIDDLSGLQGLTNYVADVGNTQVRMSCSGTAAQRGPQGVDLWQGDATLYVGGLPSRYTGYRSWTGEMYEVMVDPADKIGPSNTATNGNGP